MPTSAQLRILVSDPPTPGATPIFPNEHYDAIGAMETNLYKAAGNAARSLAAYFAQKVTVTAGPVKIESSAKSEHYIKIAKQFDDLSKTAGHIEPGGTGVVPSTIIGAPVSGGVLTGVRVSEIDDIRSDPDRYDSVFYRGMDDASDLEESGEAQ